jgi:hypothetical protein
MSLELTTQGINMVMPDPLKPNIRYVLQKIREVAGGAAITSSLVMQLTMQAMMFAGDSGPELGGKLKKDVVIHSLRKLVLETEMEVLSKSALLMILQDGGLVSVSIDQLIFASKQAKELFTGMTKSCFCGLKSAKPKALPSDFDKSE